MSIAQIIEAGGHETTSTTLTQVPEIAGSFLERTVVEVGGATGPRGRFG